MSLIGYSRQSSAFYAKCGRLFTFFTHFTAYYTHFAGIPAHSHDIARKFRENDHDSEKSAAVPANFRVLCAKFVDFQNLCYNIIKTRKRSTFYIAYIAFPPVGNVRLRWNVASTPPKGRPEVFGVEEKAKIHQICMLI